MHSDDEFDDEEFGDEEVFDDAFLQLLPNDARLLYESLIHAIKSNSGIGFHNHDQGHLINAGGAVQINDAPLGEPSDDNELFSLLNRLAPIINKDGQTGVKVYTWPEFFKMAVAE
jgi:hypothetical protein